MFKNKTIHTLVSNAKGRVVGPPLGTRRWAHLDLTASTVVTASSYPEPELEQPTKSGPAPQEIVLLGRRELPGQMTTPC